MLNKLYDFLIALLILAGISAIVYIFINRDLFLKVPKTQKENPVSVENLHPVELKISSHWLKGAQNIRGKTFFAVSKKEHIVYASFLNDPTKMILIGDFVVVTEPNAGNIVVLRDTNRDNSADDKLIFESGLRYPYGLAYKDGNLYVSTEGSILVYKDFLNQLKNTNPSSEVLVSNLPATGIGKKRPLLIGNDNRIYVGIGASCNSCIEEDRRRASVVSYNLDGTNEEIYASGFKEPTDLESYLGFTYLLEESMRSSKIEIPQELNRLKEKAFYGWPFLYGDNVKVSPDTPKVFDFDKAEPPILTFESKYMPAGLSSSLNNKNYEGLLISLNSQKESKVLYFDLNNNVKELFVWKDFSKGFVANIEDLVPYKKGLLVTDSKNGTIYYLSL